MIPKILYLDVETAGTDPARHAIVQVGVIIEIDGKEEERIDLEIAPFPDDEISEDALKISKRTPEDLVGYMEPRKAHESIVATLSSYVDKYNRADKFQLVAYNAKFDDDFLRAFFRKCGDTYYGSLIHWPPIDVAGVLAYQYMAIRHEFKNFQLSTVAEKLGITLLEEDAHDAMADVRVTREIFHRLKTAREDS